MELGQKLKEARNAAGLKQEELSHELGVSRQTISNWENGRSLPDIGSVVKLSSLYGLSLDELLTDNASMLKAAEDLSEKRRKFWQGMLELGVILELLGVLLAGLGYTTVPYLTAGAGVLLLYLAIFMHLRVFDHDRGQLFRGLLGMALLLCCQIMALAGIPWPHELLTHTVLTAARLLILSAGVWTMDWKSTRLWLIIVLLIGALFLPLGSALQDSGQLNAANPFGEDYQITEVLYPEGAEAPEYTKIRLNNVSYVEDRNGESTELGKFIYTEPVAGQTQKGIWQYIPEDDPDALYKLTVEADDRVILAYYEQEQLQWKWLLTDYGRDTCFVTVSTLGSTMLTRPDWYAPGRTDPKPYLTEVDVAGSATLNITVGGLDTEALTLTEEYHYGDHVETQTYTLEPKKPGNFTLKLQTRYDGAEEWALYRIPYQDGEYRFTLTFG